MPERLKDQGFMERLQKVAMEKGRKNNNQFANALNKTASATDGINEGYYSPSLAFLASLFRSFSSCVHRGT